MFEWRKFIIGMGFYGLSMTVLAAAELPQNLVDLPWTQVLVGAALALWGGLTRTAERLLAAKKEDATFHFAHEVWRDVMASVLIAGLTVFLGAWQHISIYLLGFGLGIGGYIGTPLLVRLGDAWSEKLTKVIGGDKPDKGPKP